MVSEDITIRKKDLQAVVVHKILTSKYDKKEE
jgi:hypothetical protein